MKAVTILGKKVKNDLLLSDFSPDESNSIMLGVAKNLQNVLGEVDEERVHDGERLKTIKMNSKDESVSCLISHIPVDTFGENHAEVRAVLSIKPTATERHSEIYDAINEEDFDVKVTS